MVIQCAVQTWGEVFFLVWNLEHPAPVHPAVGWTGPASPQWAAGNCSNCCLSWKCCIDSGLPPALTGRGGCRCFSGAESSRMLLRTVGWGYFKCYHVVILECLCLDQVTSSNRSRSVSCPLPGGAWKRDGDSQGRQKPISPAVAVRVRSDGVRGVPSY